MTIFTNEKDVESNINKSLDKLGVGQTPAQPRFMAKRKCKSCWGQGVLNLITPDNEKKSVFCSCVVEVK